MKSYAPNEAFSREVVDTVKGTVAHMKAPTASVKRAIDSAIARWVIFPKYVPGAATHLEPQSQASAFMRVADNAFNYSLLGLTGFTALGALLDSVQCFDFHYSAMDEAMEIFATLEAKGG